MIFLNSRTASYISGERLDTDHGAITVMATGQLECAMDSTLLKKAR